MKNLFTLIIIVLFSSACQTTIRDISSSNPPVKKDGSCSTTKGTLIDLSCSKPEPQKIFSRQPLALVIGNNEYEHSPLNNPINDATDMAKLLTEKGFNVTLKTNLKQRDMENTIREFGKRLSETRGIGLFYYAGHGAQVKGRNYLLPLDNNRIQHETDLKYHAVYVNEILDKMEKAKTTLNIRVVRK